MPSFTPINDVNAINSNQTVEELNIYKINNKEGAVKHVKAALTKPLDFIPKE